MEARGCTGIPYLNTCKREIFLLNLGLSSLALSLNVGEDEWLMTEKYLTAKVSTMQVCIFPRNKVPVKMRQLKIFQISRDATVGISIHGKIPLSVIKMV